MTTPDNNEPNHVTPTSTIAVDPFTGRITGVVTNARGEPTPPAVQNEYMALCRRAFANQNRLNSHLDAAWVGTDWDFQLAAEIEIRECYDHLNWAWWKPAKYGEPPSEDQLHQIHLELADTFHFLLSQTLRNLAKTLDAEATTYPSTAEPRTQLAELERAQEITGMYTSALKQWQTSSRDVSRELRKALAAYFHDGLSAYRDARFFRFFAVCVAAELSFEKLMLYYFAKGVLNGFRWSHGYREANPAKRYKKHWYVDSYCCGAKPELVEDNAVLARWLQDHDGLTIGGLAHLEEYLSDAYARSEYNYAMAATD